MGIASQARADAPRCFEVRACLPAAVQEGWGLRPGLLNMTQGSPVLGGLGVHAEPEPGLVRLQKWSLGCCGSCWSRRWVRSRDGQHCLGLRGRVCGSGRATAMLVQVGGWAALFLGQMPGYWFGVSQAKSALVGPFPGREAEAVPQQLILLQTAPARGAVCSDPSSDSPTCCSPHPPQQRHPSRMLGLPQPPLLCAPTTSVRHRDLAQPVPCQGEGWGVCASPTHQHDPGTRSSPSRCCGSCCSWLSLPESSTRAREQPPAASGTVPKVPARAVQTQLGCGPGAPTLACLGAPCSSEGRAVRQSQSHWARGRQEQPEAVPGQAGCEGGCTWGGGTREGREFNLIQTGKTASPRQAAVLAVVVWCLEFLQDSVSACRLMHSAACGHDAGVANSPC